MSKSDQAVSHLVSQLEALLDAAELARVVRVLHESYSGIMADWEVWELLVAAFPAELQTELRALQPTVVGHRILNDVVMRHYPGERVLKYHLAREHLHRSNEVSLFEVPVGGSRLDYGRVNGESYAYEIKTELDTVGRLAKQVDDYGAVFEHVTAWVHEKHVRGALGILPDYCGLVAFVVADGVPNSETVRVAQKSPAVNAEKQIECLSSADIAYVLKWLGITPIPSLRAEREASLRSACTDDEGMGELFKLAMKNKFGQRWQRLQALFDRILPIDVGLFYSAGGVDPAWVYYKNSSMV